MADNFSLENNGKFGKIDFSKLRAGLKKDDIAGNDEFFKSLFNKFDTSKDGSLSRAEINSMVEELKQLAMNDGELSTGEAKKFQLDGEEIGRKNVKNFFNFLNKLSEATVGVRSVQVNGNSEIVNFENGTKEELFEDGSKRTTYTDGSMVYVDKNGIKIEETVIQDGKTINTKYVNGEKSRETITEGENKQTIIEYENGEEVKKIVTTQDTIETFYKKNGKDVRIVENKNTGLVQTFIGGVLAKEENKKTNSTSVHKDGLVTTTTKTEDGEIITVTDSDGNLKSETVTKKSTDGSTQVSKTEYDGENSTTTVSVDGRNISQTKVIEGKTYSVRYDGEGNTYVIVQNGESIASLAKKFECSVDEIVKVNSDKVKGRGSNLYFLVGEEIKIPKELQADHPGLLNRKSAQEAEDDYKRFDDEKRAEKEAERAREEEVRREGEQRKQLEREQQQRKADKAKANTYAQQFYDIADKSHGMKSMEKMLSFLNSNINSSNIVDFLNAYVNPEIRQKDSSIIDTVISEVGAGSALNPIAWKNGSQKQKAVLTQIINTLCKAAEEAGVSQADIESIKKSFVDSMNAELDNSMKKTDPTKMEIALDALLGKIAAAKSGVVAVDEDAAMDVVAGDFKGTNDKAQSDFETARKEDSWIAKAGDKICGWFGCNTVEEMREKLGENAEKVDALIAASQKGDKSEFKRIYKELFGVEFDANLIAASEKAIENYNNAVNAQQQLQAINEVFSKINSSMSYQEIANVIKEMYSDIPDVQADTVIDEIIAMYSANGVSAETEDDKKAILLSFVEDSKAVAQKMFDEYTAEKSIEELAREAELISKSAYGTNDISKMVNKFNQNMVMTDAVGTAAVEITATILLQFIPGLGQVAAARLAVSAGRLGATGVRVANYAQKAGKMFNTISKLQNGTASASKVVNAVTRIGVQAVGAGAATAAVGVSKKDEAKTILHRTLMNMSFAGAGAGSNMLAPKLMQAFGIEARLATEIAEEIINAAASYGISTIHGEVYGTEDAFLDFVTGLIISRVAGAGAGGAFKATDVPDPTPRPTPKPQPDPTPIPDPKNVHEMYSVLDDTPVRLRDGREITSIHHVGEYLNDMGIFDGHVRAYFKTMWQENPNRFYRVVNTGLFDLVAKGYIDRDTFSSLLPGYGRISKQGTILSHRTLADIKMMKEQIDAGITKPSAVKIMPNDAPDFWVNSNVKVGEVYQDTAGKLFIKVDSGNFVQLKMSKEKYDELFPLLGNTAFRQGVSLGDCWLVSALDGAMDIPMAKAQLLSLFEQVGDDIHIKFPNAQKPIVFKNGEIIPVPGYQITGNAKGIQMLEQAYSIHRNNHYSDTPMSVVDITDSCLDISALHNELDGGFSVKAWEELFAGVGAQVFCSDMQTLMQCIKNANVLDCMVGISFTEDIRFACSYLSRNHAYMIKSFDEAKGLVYLTNPHNSSTLIEVPISVLEQEFSKVKKVETFRFFDI